MLEHIGMKRKKQHKLIKNATQGNILDGTGERRKTKKLLRHDKTIQIKQEISK